MPRFVFDSVVDVAPELLFAWHEQQGAFHRMLPPWSGAEIRRYDGLRLGAQTEIRIPVGPGYVTWLTETREIEQSRSFTDVQVKGPFRNWEHTHLITSTSDNHSRLVDHIDVTYPRAFAVAPLLRERLERNLGRAFTYRHSVIQNDLLRVRQYTTAQPLRVAISGASGLLGSSLRHFLDAAGHDVFVLVRHKPRNDREIFFDYRSEEVDVGRLKGMDAVVHLEGETMAAVHWGEERRMRIHASRVRSTAFLSQTLAGLDRRPTLLITASTVGIYGDRPGERLEETAVPGEHGFLSVLGRDWESASDPAQQAGIRTVHLRFGLVVSPRNPLIRLVLDPLHLGVAARFKKRSSALSWISHDDALYGILHALVTQSLQGGVNVVSSTPSTLGEFLESLRRTRTAGFPIGVPERALRLVLGDVASEVLLLDQHAIPQRLLDTGFRYAFPSLDQAVAHQFGQSTARGKER